MKQDFVLSESEFSIAANKITSFADFLERSVYSCRVILDELRTQGISDRCINAQVAALDVKLQSGTGAMQTVVKELSRYVNDTLAKAESGDHFSNAIF